MRFWFAGIVMFAQFFAIAVINGAIKELPSQLVFGKPYVNLNDYAKSKNLQISLDSTNNVVILSSRWSKLEFTVDSKRCLINGVVVWLSFPVAKQNGNVFISPIDIKSAIEPVLNHPKSLVKEKIRMVCIDAGHGGKDPGNMEGKHMEKVFTLSLAYEVKRQLEKTGLNVCLTRVNDTFLDLSERPQIARRKGANLFVSIHFNSSPSKSAKGIETYCMTPAEAGSTNARGNTGSKILMTGNKNDSRNMLLAWNIQKSLVKLVSADDRGIKRARFAVLKDATMPAVLIECGFMSNPEDMQKIQDVAWRRQLAKGIVEGILNYKKQVEQ